MAALLATHYLQETYASSSSDHRKQVATNTIGDSHASWDGRIPRLPDRSDSKLSPVILLPGDGGSRLEAKLNRKEVLHKYCVRRSDDWFDLWVNLSLLVPFAIECWVEK